VQSTSASPEPGFGSFGTLGPAYAFVYLPNQGQGTLRIDLAAPATAFALDLTDVGEVEGVINLRTNVGAFAAGVNVATFPPTFANGSAFFYGLTQNVAFTQIFLTVSGIDEAYGIDNVRVAVVPEPVTLALWGLGLGALALRRRRDRAGSA
jgi:hypothetical protein